jgi:DNA-directed RNA polymerase specialized sigma24 family protein
MANNTIGSVSKWILGARQGDPVAIEQIVSRYFARLARSVRSMQDAQERQLKSGKDVSADILMKISRELSAGEHQELQNRNDLWVLLISIVEEYVIRRRDGRQQHDDIFPLELPLTDYLNSCDQDLELMLSKGNKYGNLQAILDQMEDLVAMVKDPKSKEIASLKLQGLSNREIGSRLGIVAKTVDRKMKKIVSRWTDYLDNQGTSS